jgi:hypothetical protein
VVGMSAAAAELGGSSSKGATVLTMNSMGRVDPNTATNSTDPALSSRADRLPTERLKYRTGFEECKLFFRACGTGHALAKLAMHSIFQASRYA